MLDNWSQFKTDANGNGSYSSSETETRTNDNQNRITEQIYSTSSLDRDLVNDKAGNLREVQQASGSGAGNALWEYVYDGWHRLAKVKRRRTASEQNSHVVAEHEYNALGWRTVERIDTAATNFDDVLDRQTVFFYSESWQLVAEEYYDGGSPGSYGSVDRATYNTPGLLYIDEVIHRGYDDGTNVNHSYILRDPQYSTVALIDTTAKIRERVDYSAFGLARHHQFGDLDGDGPDTSLISGLAAGTNCSGSATLGGGCYHAEADLDRDGDVDGSDVGLANGTTFAAALAPGELSATKNFNRIGYCGYVYNNHIQTYSVRFRDYVPHRGRWLQADPSGYPDGSNRQSYMRGNPIGWVDPFGLQTEPAFQGGMSADPVQFGTMGHLEIKDDGSILRIIHIYGAQYRLHFKHKYNGLDWEGVELIEAQGRALHWAINNWGDKILNVEEFDPNGDAGELVRAEQMKGFQQAAQILKPVAVVAEVAITSANPGADVLVSWAAFQENPGLWTCLGLGLAVTPFVSGSLVKQADDIAVIGRQADTAVAADWPGHEVLNLAEWSLDKNDEWIRKVIKNRQKVYLGSSPTLNNLRHADGSETVFGREYRMLLEAGYVREGDYLIPP